MVKVQNNFQYPSPAWKRIPLMKRLVSVI